MLERILTGAKGTTIDAWKHAQSSNDLSEGSIFTGREKAGICRVVAVEDAGTKHQVLYVWDGTDSAIFPVRYGRLICNNSALEVKKVL